MVSWRDDDPGRLSDAELEELLAGVDPGVEDSEALPPGVAPDGQAPADSGPRPGGSSAARLRHRAPRVLAITRGRTDTTLLLQRLEAHGAHVLRVRSPFRGLDALRDAPPDAVVSDLDLWAEEGSLLLERVARLVQPCPILLAVRGQNPALLERLRSRGVWGLLLASAGADDLEELAVGILDRIGSPPSLAGEGPQPQPGPITSTSPPSLAGEGPGGDRSALGARSPEPTSAQVEAPLPGVPGQLAPTEVAELRWLRLFLQLTRLRVEGEPLASRAREVLELACQHLCASGGLLAYPDRGGTAAVVRIAPGAGAGLGRRLLASLDARTPDTAPGTTESRMARLRQPLRTGAEVLLLLELPGEDVARDGLASGDGPAGDDLQAERDVLRVIGDILTRP